jgi:hypothetical protein
VVSVEVKQEISINRQQAHFFLTCFSLLKREALHFSKRRRIFEKLNGVTTEIIIFVLDYIFSI